MKDYFRGSSTEESVGNTDLYPNQFHIPSSKISLVIATIKLNNNNKINQYVCYEDPSTLLFVRGSRIHHLSFFLKNVVTRQGNPINVEDKVCQK